VGPNGRHSCYRAPERGGQGKAMHAIQNIHTESVCTVGLPMIGTLAVQVR